MSSCHVEDFDLDQRICLWMDIIRLFQTPIFRRRRPFCCSECFEVLRLNLAGFLNSLSFKGFYHHLNSDDSKQLTKWLESLPSHFTLVLRETIIQIPYKINHQLHTMIKGGELKVQIDSTLNILIFGWLAQDRESALPTDDDDLRHGQHSEEAIKWCSLHLWYRMD